MAGTGTVNMARVKMQGNKIAAKAAGTTEASVGACSFFDKLILHWLGISGVVIACGLCLQTQDSAQIKITSFYVSVLGLFALWVSSLIYERRNIFTVKNLITLLPFILYFAYAVFSYFAFPYKLARLELFARFCGYSFIFLVLAFRGSADFLAGLLKYIIGICWVVFAYGALQVINNYIVKGADFLFWTDFFARRVFSTIANPNFFGNFCAFGLMFCFASYLYTRKKSLLILMGLGLVDIFFTESKGSWLALALGTLVFAALYANFFSAFYNKHKFKFNSLALLGLLAVSLLVGYFALNRWQSVNFRLSTWRSTFEMAQAKPLVGTGIGSFAAVYPSYKRPEIFYMEGIHNAETRHAENYYLEQWAILGTLGFGIYLLAFFYMLGAARRKFKQINLSAQGQERQRNFLLLAFACAAAVIYIHNFVDVSIYFVSTSYFLTLFNGALFALCLGPLESKIKPYPPAAAAPGNNFIFYLFAVLCAAVLLFIAGSALKDFALITAGARKRIIVYIIYWLSVIAVSAGIFWAFAKVIFKTKSFAVALLCVFCGALMLLPLRLTKAEYFLALAGYFADKDKDKALLAYTRAIEFAPFISQYYNFRGLVLSSRLDTARTYQPKIGDSRAALMNDFDRALRDFNKANYLTPNDVLINYNLGVLHYAYALKPFHDEAARERLFGAAEAYYRKALLLDPVYDNTYFQLTNIALQRKDYKAAFYWLEKYRAAPRGVINEEYLSRHKNNEKASGHYFDLAEILPPGDKEEIIRRVQTERAL